MVDRPTRHLGTSAFGSTVELDQMTTPQLHMQTLFRLDDDGRIVGTREPGAVRGPVFWLARGLDSCAWAVRCDTPKRVARELANLAADEPPAGDSRAPPVHARRYRSLIDGDVQGGPAFHLPDSLPDPTGVVFADDVSLLVRYFPGWTADEVGGRAPIAAVEHDESAISVCCCARKSGHATEAGLETAREFRGRGLAARVSAAWALAVRSSGRIPLYSTSWDNAASLAVARKLGLSICASAWSVNDAVSRDPARPP